MYTFAPSSHARRSAQTVLWKITEALVRLVAPILSFTADEVWDYLPTSGRPRSQCPSGAVSQAGRGFFGRPLGIVERVEAALFGIRNEVLRSASKSRKAKQGIGKDVEAKVQSLHGREVEGAYERNESSLKEFFNVSEVEFRSALISVLQKNRATEFLTGRTATNLRAINTLPVVELASGRSAPAAGTSCPKSPPTASGRTFAPLPGSAHRNGNRAAAGGSDGGRIMTHLTWVPQACLELVESLP